MSDILGPWMRDLNSRGGVDSHPIERIVVDDGGDPARHFAAVRDLVENRNVFAFVMNSMVLSGSQSVRQYLEQNGVPVVGGDVPEPTWYQSPVFFPQITTLEEHAVSLPVAIVHSRPQLKKWGQMNCREVEACSVLAKTWAETAERHGLSVVYRAQVSLAQPDYTAECLGARNAGAEILAVGVDTNASRRVAQSCARQGYRPTFALAGGSVSPGHNGDANFEGAFGAIRSAPWTAVGVPGVRAMHDAIKRYAPDLQLAGGSTMGWSAGKLFEAGAAAAGGLGSPPTRERLIDGLYRLRGETNGGVSPPLTFERGKNKLVPCWFVMEFTNGSWKDANGGRHDCP
jgi:branched-chain amino acid transport system substrate-binding protein